VSKKQLVEVQNQLNDRHRKTLEYDSPLNTISRLYINQNFI
jgi:IS30 family transposase